MPDHSSIVTERYLTAENRLEDAWYDSVFREEEYYAEEDTPFLRKEADFPKGGWGRVVGEMDLALVDWQEKVLYVEEVKTSYGDLGYAEEQLDRVDEHFEDWTVIKRKILET